VWDAFVWDACLFPGSQGKHDPESDLNERDLLLDRGRTWGVGVMFG